MEIAILFALIVLSGLFAMRLPKVADVANWEGWHIEIVDMDGKTIDKALASRQSLDEPLKDGTDPAGP